MNEKNYGHDIIASSRSYILVAIPADPAQRAKFWVYAQSMADFKEIVDHLKQKLPQVLSVELTIEEAAIGVKRERERKKRGD